MDFENQADMLDDKVLIDHATETEQYDLGMRLMEKNRACFSKASLEIAISHGAPDKYIEMMLRKGCPATFHIYGIVLGTNKNLVSILYENGVPWDVWMCSCLDNFGELQALPDAMKEPTDDCVIAIARYGNRGILTHMRNAGYRITDRVRQELDPDSEMTDSILEWIEECKTNLKPAKR
jgi:hypothetical protein